MPSRVSIESNLRELQASLATAVYGGRSRISGWRAGDWWLVGAVFLLFLCFGQSGPAWSAGGSPIPGENRVSVFYAVTHLHAAAYLLLFFVFLLAAANLLFQYGTGIFRKPISSLSSMIKKPDHVIPPRQVLKGLKPSNRHGPAGAKPRKPFLPAQNRVAGLEAVGPVQQGAGPSTAAKPLTPLDGVNHPLPQFPSPAAGIAGSPRVGQGKLETAAAVEFKFSSAVDVPSREQIERREKLQLMVSGVVQGPDGKGMSSVIVYLTDSGGKRVGQSCRSAADTGEFKVLINEPGRYAIKGYKRGFVMESSEPLELPIESGKIEGYNFTMVPERSLVSGRLLPADDGPLPAGYEVRFTCKTPEYVQSCRTDSSGQFRIEGAPVSSECYFEILNEEGDPLMRSAPFRTGPKKEHFVEIRLPEDGSAEKTSVNREQPAAVEVQDEKSGSSGVEEPDRSRQSFSSV